MNPTAQIAVATINAPPGTPSATASLSTNQLILVRKSDQDFVNNNYGTLNYVRNFQDQATNSRPMIPTAPLLPLR